VKEPAGDALREDRSPAFVRLLVRAERGLSVVLLGTLVALMAAQVVARYVFGSPIAWTEELARFVLIWLGFMGAAFVMGEGRHIAVDVVSRTLSRRGRLALECVSSAAVVAACAMLLPAGLAFAQRMGSVRSPALGIPMSWWYWAAGAGFTLLALHTVANLVAAIRLGEPLWDDQRGYSAGPDGTA
jgi:TRAP-type transport system small permease protein